MSADQPPETQHQPPELGRVAVDGKRADGEHRAWCSPEHCYWSLGVQVHQQAATRWEDEAAEVAVESRLVDPVDESNVYVELSLQDLRLKSVQYYGLLPLEVGRRLRDQLTAHLDAVQ